VNKEKQAMNTEEKYLKDATNEIIVESQEESEEDDEITFVLFVDGKIVSWAKTLLYSNLKEIHTACKEKRKGYGKKLLAHMEKNAKAHGATAMKTCFDDPRSDEASGFFKNLGYMLSPVIRKP
jgi:GNAT superfamily N-acetyltransferase